MAKKATKAEETVEVAPQPTSAKTAPVQPKKPEWEIKDRVYFIKGNKKPLVFSIPSRHSTKKSLTYFDEETGMQRELRYATNQNSPFVDEQKGAATLGRIIFREGVLNVPKQNQILQKLLSLYHPFKDKFYVEYKPEQQASNEIDYIEYELEAMNTAKSMDIEQAEAILRVEFGSKVSKLTSSELKRDLLIYAKRNPILFLELANDENVELRNVGIKATEARIIKLSADQRTFSFGETGRKLMTVPFDEHPYSALAAYFKTDEGMEVYKNILKRLK
jgi:hypothetical protein